MLKSCWCNNYSCNHYSWRYHCHMLKSSPILWPHLTSGVHDLNTLESTLLEYTLPENASTQLQVLFFWLNGFWETILKYSFHYLFLGKYLIPSIVALPPGITIWSKLNYTTWWCFQKVLAFLILWFLRTFLKRDHWTTIVNLSWSPSINIMVTVCIIYFLHYLRMRV